MQVLFWVAFCLVLNESAGFSYEGHQVISVVPKTEQQLKALQLLHSTTDVDFWTAPVLNRKTDIHVSPYEWQYIHLVLATVDLRYDVTIKNLESLIQTERLSRLSTPLSDSDYSILLTYARHSNINQFLDQIAADYPKLCSVQSIGKTYEGREMKIIKISGPTGGPRSTKPAIWLDAGIHAREWVTPSSAIYIIHQLISKYKTDSKVKSLLDKYTFYILPSANPDGYEYSFTQRLWRKTRSPQGASSWGSGMCYGADPNRNFDNHFAQVGVSSYKCSDIYPGSKPFSENCTNNMRNFWLKHKGELKAYYSLHAYSQLWLTPNSYSSAQVHDHAELMRVANIGVNAIKNVNGRYFTAGPSPVILYACSGTSADYAREQIGMNYAYILELYPASRYPGFVVPVSSMPGIAKEIWAGLTAAWDAMKL